MSAATLAPADVQQLLSVRRRFTVWSQEWLLRHRLSMALLGPVLLVVGLVRGVGMSTYPRYIDDPGTYLSQAWSLQYEGTLSPYSYFYDHAPGGWVQLALWSTLTRGFDRYDSAIGFGNECMLLAGIASTALVFGLGRRLGLTRGASAVAALLFGLSPLSVLYGRWTFLDNLVTPWLLAAFILALSPRRNILPATGAAVCFAMAALTKETTLILLPAFGWAMWRNADPRNRGPVLTVAAGAGALLAAMYPLLALYKGELFAGPGHNSLLGTAAWQLSGRESTGSLLTAGSPMRDMLNDWLQRDPILLVGGLGSVLVAVFVPRLRPIALALVIGWLMMVRGGYVPFMHVVTLLPWSALLLAAAVATLLGRLRPGAMFVNVTMAMLLAIPVMTWTPQLAPMMSTVEVPAMRSAELWVAHNVPRDKTLVVHDSIWVDMVHRYRFQERPVMVQKLDADPAVQEQPIRVDYLIVPNWYYLSPTAQQASPTLIEARKHAVMVASFGSGPDGVDIYRVSGYWRP